MSVVTHQSLVLWFVRGNDKVEGPHRDCEPGGWVGLRWAASISMPAHNSTGHLLGPRPNTCFAYGGKELSSGTLVI